MRPSDRGVWGRVGWSVADIRRSRGVNKTPVWRPLRLQLAESRFVCSSCFCTAAETELLRKLVPRFRFCTISLPQLEVSHTHTHTHPHLSVKTLNRVNALKAVIFLSPSGKRILPLAASYLAISECCASSQGCFVVLRLTGWNSRFAVFCSSFLCFLLQLLHKHTHKVFCVWCFFVFFLDVVSFCQNAKSFY